MCKIRYLNHNASQNAKKKKKKKVIIVQEKPVKAPDLPRNHFSCTIESVDRNLFRRKSCLR